MEDRHGEWIRTNVPKAMGACAEITTQMCIAFPELARVRGHYIDHQWGSRAHWWCVDPDGGIVDPTAAQFPSKGSGQYVPWDEEQVSPTGMCPNCGEYCYEHRSVCSDRCAASYAAYLDTGVL